MPQNYIIFSNANRLVLEHNPAWPFFNGNITDAVHEFELGLEEEILLNVPNLDAALEEIKVSYHKVVLAAGGLVKTPGGKTLFIYRLGKWDLPKGKVEHGESMDAAAVREVEEETGLRNIELGRLLTKTYHTYPHKGHQVIKETWWYAMTAPEQRLIPQQEEDISQAVWIAANEIQNLLEDTYGNIRLVVGANSSLA